MVPLLEINSWPVGDRVGMGEAIQILEKSLGKGIHGGKYLQSNTVRQLRTAVSYFYSATSTYHDSIYLLKSHMGQCSTYVRGRYAFVIDGKVC